MQFWHQHNLLSNQGFYFAVVIFWWWRAHSLIRITSNVILITNQAKSCCLIEENAVRYWVEGAANRDKASSIWPWLSSPLSSCTSSVTPSGSFSGSSWWLWLVSSLLSRCLPTSCMIKVPASSSVSLIFGSYILYQDSVFSDQESCLQMSKWNVSNTRTPTSLLSGSCAWRAWPTCWWCSTSQATSSSTAQSASSSSQPSPGSAPSAQWTTPRVAE